MAAPRSSVFTFESTVHSLHVLQCLDEQRRRDMLCDVTVLVEGQSFRAHCSVLASCSEYFTHRLSNLTQQGAVIVLPEQITVNGFEQLLNFAYTSKLLCGKDNIHEIRNAASILGFRDLDDACFEFLLPKFMSESKDFVQKRKHCKKKCHRKLWEKHSGPDAHDVILDEEEVKPVSDSSFQPDVNWDCEKKQKETSGIQSNAESLTPLLETTTHATFMQCPKYRKFQLACGKESMAAISHYCLLSCSTSTNNTHTSENMNSWTSHKSKASNDQAEINDMKTENITTQGDVEMIMTHQEIADGDNMNQDTGVNWIKIEKDMDQCNVSPKPMLGDMSAQLISHQYESPALTRSPGQEIFVTDFEEDKKSCDPGEPVPVPIHPKTDKVAETQEKRFAKTCRKGKTEIMAISEDKTKERNTMKNELPQDQNKEPALDADSSQEGPKLHNNFSTSRNTCPFLKDREQQECSGKGAGLSECDGASYSGVSSLNSGEDEDLETESEGDSESCTRERALQMQLPVPVDWVVDLSRNDFQLLLKQQDFTREQLEFINETRRRSKNRLAARRCRKRKLDCIYSLQCEINKLKTEREKLLVERGQLGQLKLKTCQNVSALCQKVCSQENLQPGQLQVLAKYTSADCSLSSFFPCIDMLLSQHGLSPQQTSSSSCRDHNPRSTAALGTDPERETL